MLERLCFCECRCVDNGRWRLPAPVALLNLVVGEKELSCAARVAAGTRVHGFHVDPKASHVAVSFSSHVQSQASLVVDIQRSNLCTEVVAFQNPRSPDLWILGGARFLEATCELI